MSVFDKEKLYLIFEKLKKDKKAFLIILLGLSGMLLISLSELMPEKTDDIKKSSKNIVVDYNVHERQELERIIGLIEGAGKVSVMITYEGTSESIYASDISSQKNESNSSTDTEHIILDKGNIEDGLLLKEIYPKVTGVAVVCEGGGSAAVKNEITMMIKALYNLSSNSICVSEMNR